MSSRARRRSSRSITFDPSELEHKKNILLGQALSIGMLLLQIGGLGIIMFFFPDFFSYTYFKWGGWESILRFWPVFAWGILATALIRKFSGFPLRESEDKTVLGYGLVTSTLAGIWEELAFRWVLICYGMISVMVANFLYGTVLGWFVTIVSAIAAIVAFGGKKFLLGIVLTGMAIISGYFASFADPLYWFYEHIGVTAIHWVTFGQMDTVLYGQYDKLFIFGAILANFWFRNGHRYQGPLGIINSWYLGMIFLYCTLTYGLWTAIVVHALYNIGISFVSFLLRRSNPKQQTKALNEN